MDKPSIRIRPGLLTLLALCSLAWAVVGLALASLTTSPVLHHPFHNVHAEHLGAFYVVALLGVAAFPIFSIRSVLLTVALFAIVLEAARLFIPLHRDQVLEDMFCDLAGVAAVLAPILVERVRRSFQAAKSAGSAPTEPAAGA